MQGVCANHTMVLAVGFYYMAFIMLRYDPSITTSLRVFYHKSELDFIEWFFCIYWYGNVIFTFNLCDVLHLLICEYCTSLASHE